MRCVLTGSAMVLVLVMPVAATAQSTGTVDAEKEIVVEGTRRPRDVNGIETPDTPKAKAVLTQELIERRTPD